MIFQIILPLDEERTLERLELFFISRSSSELCKFFKPHSLLVHTSNNDFIRINFRNHCNLTFIDFTNHFSIQLLFITWIHWNVLILLWNMINNWIVSDLAHFSMFLLIHRIQMFMLSSVMDRTISVRQVFVIHFLLISLFNFNSIGFKILPCL